MNTVNKLYAHVKYIVQVLLSYILKYEMVKKT